MTLKKGSIKALAIVIVLLSIIVVSKNDNKQIEKETHTYKQISEASYEAYLFTTSEKQAPETVEEAVPTVQINLQGLEPYKSAFIKAGQQFGVDPKLLISIAILESGWGEFKQANGTVNEVMKAKNNFFGWTCEGEYATYSSPEECIMTFAKCLKQMYLTEGGVHFRGYGIEDIAICYNTVSTEKWAEEVKYIYERLV